MTAATTTHPATAPPAPPTEEPVLAAARACIARRGIAKTSIDDVAREAGCGRATLYRRYGSRGALVAAAMRDEVRRVLEAVGRAGAAASTLDDAVVAMLTTGARQLSGSACIRAVVEREPELVHPHLAFAGGSRTLASVSGALAPALEPFLPAEDAARAAEWVARLGLSLLLAPDAPVSLRDEAATRRYVRTYVVPAFAPFVRHTADPSGE